MTLTQGPKMHPLLVLGFLMAIAAVGHSDEEESTARLLLSKQLHNKYLVENMDIVVKYTMYNVGNAAASDVQLMDNSFPVEGFDVIGGHLKVRLDRIPPGSNATHIVVVRPKMFGYFNFTAAEVTYIPKEGSTKAQVGFSSEPGEGAIIAYRDYDRKFSPHVLDWAAFAVMTLPSLGIPFILWYSSKVKYEAIMSAKKERTKDKDM